jgi:hypothetical protein
MAAIDPARSWAMSITRTPSNALAMAAPDLPRNPASMAESARGRGDYGERARRAKPRRR